MKRAVELKPDWPPYQFILAQCYDLVGQPDKAQSLRAIAAELEQAANEAYRAAQIAVKSDIRDVLQRVMAIVLPQWGYAEDVNPALRFGHVLDLYDLDNVKDWMGYQPPPQPIGTHIDLGMVGQFIAGAAHEVINKRIARKMPWELPIALLLMELAVRCYPDNVMADIGANIGTLTIPLARHFKGQVICFEPLPQNYDKLTAHIELNKLNNVTAYNQACSRKMGSGRMMRILDDNLGMAQLDTSTSGETEIVTLDNVIAGQTLALIKIDVEGHEIDVLSGAMDSILRDKPVIIVEVWGNEDNPLHAFLSPWGYKGMKVFRSDWIFYPSS